MEINYQYLSDLRINLIFALRIEEKVSSFGS